MSLNTKINAIQSIDNYRDIECMNKVLDQLIELKQNAAAELQEEITKFVKETLIPKIKELFGETEEKEQGPFMQLMQKLQQVLTFNPADFASLETILSFPATVFKTFETLKEVLVDPVLKEIQELQKLLIEYAKLLDKATKLL